MIAEHNNEIQKRQEEMKRRCMVRGWAFNNFTAYLLESHLTASKVAYLMNCPKATVYYWVTVEELPSTVNFLFLTARKMLMNGKDLFAYV